MTATSAAAAIQPGAELGGFRLVEHIGSDGLGELYRAQNLHAPKLLRAIRVIRAELAAQPDFRVQLLQVAELLDGLEHQNLLRVHHIGEEQELLFTVQDLLLGRTLRALTLEQRTLRPVQVVADWVYQALCGLAHAHQHGIIHQDVKPESLFLTQGGVVKVMDFETVRLGEFATTRRAHSRSTMLNLPTYFAPEFAEGASPSAVSDVYAMGLCLYEFLAGEPPYRPGGGTETQATISILLQHLTKPLPDLHQIRQDIPDGLLRILSKATAKQPAERYQSAEAFAAELLPYTGHAEPPPPAKPEPAPLSPRRLVAPPPADHDQPERPQPHLESSVIHLGWQDELPKDPPEEPSPLEITAPQPALEAAPHLEAPAVSVDASAKQSLVAPLRYLIVGVLMTAVIIAGTAAGTAYFLRFALHPAGPANPAVEPVEPGQPVSVPTVPTKGQPRVASGQSQTSPRNPADMVQIPAGSFRMGSREGFADERPEHAESVNSFWIDKYEVTVGEYGKCVGSGECRKQKSIRQPAADHKFDRFCNYGRKSRDEHPMNCVDWYQARSYCRWVGKRLPTEAEWEYAARGSDGRKFPWGNEGPNEHLLNACGRECVILGAQVGKKWNSMYAADDGWDATAPVGSFPRDKSPFGVLDMAGNVAEWTDTDYSKCYRDDCEPSGKEVVIRGGAWNDDDQGNVRASYRNRDIPLLRGSFVGFRCAKNDPAALPAKP